MAGSVCAMRIKVAHHTTSRIHRRDTGRPSKLVCEELVRGNCDVAPGVSVNLQSMNQPAVNQQRNHC